MLLRLLPAALLPLFIGRGLGLNFTMLNGQIYTPGFAIVDSPQPGTPEGGGLSLVLSEFESSRWP